MAPDRVALSGGEKNERLEWMLRDLIQRLYDGGPPVLAIGDGERS